MISVNYLIYFLLLKVSYCVDVSFQRALLWNLTSEEILQEAESIISQSKKFYDGIASIEEPSVANLLVPTIEHENAYSWREASIEFYSFISTDKELRTASAKACQMLETNTIEIRSREDIYSKYYQLWEKIKDDPKSTDEESLKYLRRAARNFHNSGFGLPREKQNELSELQIELRNLSSEFMKNMNENTRCIWFTEDELTGVPQSMIQQFETSQHNNVTFYSIHLEYDDIIPILKYAISQQTRKEALLSNMNKDHENVEIFAQIVRLRFKIAKLLGYKSYSELVLEDNMAGTPENVREFLAELKVRLYPLAQAELSKKLQLKNQDLIDRGLPIQNKFYAWDDDFYTNFLLEEEYQVDQQRLSEYFPLEQTVANILEMYEKLFDVKFVREKSPAPGSVWHKDVRKIAVYQNIKFGRPKSMFMGWLLLDLSSREGKFRHAGVFRILPAYIKPDNTRSPCFTALLCNFPKADKNGTTLLQHNDVVTFFHEMGHAMHHMLSQNRHVVFQGTRVPRDFVECPSQISEFWAWSKETLKQFSGHFQTGESLPDDLIDNLVRSKQANVGLDSFLHMLYSSFDMEMHSIESEEELAKLDITEVWNKLFEDCQLVSNDNIDNIGYTAFGHLVSGYESAYYGYLYSKVFASDIFYTLFKEDPMNLANGRRYRDVILKNGGAKDIPVLLEELLGRKPSANAYLTEVWG